MLRSGQGNFENGWKSSNLWYPEPEERAVLRYQRVTLAIMWILPANNSLTVLKGNRHVKVDEF